MTLISESSKVCFTAHLSSPVGSLNNKYSYSSRTVVYDRVVTNKGSAYNTADGVFTAPRAGTYIFIWNGQTGGENFCYLYLYKNGNSVNLAAFSDSRHSVYDGGSMSVVLELAPGDRVWVRSGLVCGYLYSSDTQSFTGCQL